jgi:hypothetical protein
LHPASNAFEEVGFALLTAIALLGLLEHVMLMLPIPADALWRLGLKSHRRAAPAAEG